MVKLCDRLRRAIDGIPIGGAITLPVDAVRGWLEDNGRSALEPDLTVKEVAKIFGRATSTITAWIRSGELRAYKLNGKEYRVSIASLEEFRTKQSQAQ